MPVHVVVGGRRSGKTGFAIVLAKSLKSTTYVIAHCSEYRHWSRHGCNVGFTAGDVRDHLDRAHTSPVTFVVDGYVRDTDMGSAIRDAIMSGTRGVNIIITYQSWYDIAPDIRASTDHLYLNYSAHRSNELRSIYDKYIGTETCTYQRWLALQQTYTVEFGDVCVIHANPQSRDAGDVFHKYGDMTPTTRRQCTEAMCETLVKMGVYRDAASEVASRAFAPRIRLVIRSRHEE